MSFGWRIPFKAGLLIVPIGLQLRRKLDESPVFVEKSRELIPLRDRYSDALR